jgi:hypothetical protein
MSKERRLKLVEVQVGQLAKERDKLLPRLAGKPHQRALFDGIETLKKLIKPGISADQQRRDEQHSDEGQTRVNTLAKEAC